MTTPAAGPGRRPRRWPWVALFLLTLPLVNPYVRGDGNGYYAYVRSAVIDHDLDFENEFRRGDPLFRTIYFEDDGALRPSMRSPTGDVVDQWAVGPSLLWLPFFLAAHLVVRVLDLLGAGIAADGFSPIYRYACAAGTALYGAAALLLSADLAARLAGRRAAALAVIAIWWASSLPVYMYFVPFHVHALSAFAVTLFLWCWIRWRPFAPEAGRWAVWGLTAGLMIDVYYLNALLLVAAAAEWAATVGARAESGRRGESGGGVRRRHAGRAGAPLRREVDRAGLALLDRLSRRVLLAVATPVAARVLGRARAVPVDAGAPGRGRRVRAVVAGRAGDRCARGAARSRSSTTWWRPTRTGTASRRSGTVSSSRSRPRSSSAWRSSSPGSGRRTGGRLARAAAPAVVAIAIVWNVGFMFQWGTNIVPNRGPVDFGQVALDQVTVVPRRMATFAWRYLTARTALTHDVEQGDIRQRRDYELKR